LKTNLVRYTVRDVCEGFVYSALDEKGLFGLGGRLTIQPEYQRSYIYADKKKDAPVIASVLKNYPLGLFYFNKLDDGSLEILDGQQRVTSIGRFVTGRFGIIDENQIPQYFSGLPADKQNQILDYELLVYECEGTESEIKEWFKTINIAGEPLNEQELLNAVYSGPFVSAGKEEFSNTLNANIQKWDAFVRGPANRQKFWERALEWTSASKKMSIGEYMSQHRMNPDISEVKTYFNSVIDWASTLFEDVDDHMRGLEWGEMFEKYRSARYDTKAINERVRELLSDPYVKSPRGIWAYLLGGETEKNLLDIRVFDEATKRSVYAKQTAAARENGTSNCPLCELGHSANQSKIWDLKEMDADHVAAWSRGGETMTNNCQMLCSTHNKAKGNR